MNEASDNPLPTENPRKRKKDFSSRDKAKFACISGHSTGPDCHCKRHKCFSVVSPDQRLEIINRFNSLTGKAEQDSLLAQSIEISETKRHRPRGKVDEAKLKEHSLKYFVRG